MPRISIIIPVYNSAKTMERSVGSVLSQTERDIEVILVDDGSSDESLSICEKYAESDKRVRVISQKNSGVSAARNAGIGIASGDYIGFADSDDSVSENMYGRMLAAADGRADIVMCDATTVFENGVTEEDTITGLPGSAVLGKADFTPKLLLEMAGSACRCIYKRELLLKNGICFPVGVKLSEDRVFNMYAMGKAGTVSYIKESYYNRYVERKSAVNRFHDDYFEICKMSAACMERAINEAWDGNGEIIRAFNGQFVSGSLSAICNYYYKTSTLTGKEKREHLRTVCNDEQLNRALKNSEETAKGNWILNKRYGLLACYAVLSNFKHGR